MTNREHPERDQSSNRDSQHLVHAFAGVYATLDSVDRRISRIESILRVQTLNLIASDVLSTLRSEADGSPGDNHRSNDSP